MITQFRERYPNGSLISELLAIDHGKFIVRVLVQVEEVILATGLAAAETVELAEDQARKRALDILGSAVMITPPQPANAAPANLYAPPSLTEATTTPTESTHAVLTPVEPNMTGSTIEEGQEDWLSATYLNKEKGKTKPKKESSADSFSAKGRSASLPPFPLNNPEVSGNEIALSEEATVSPATAGSSVRVREPQDFSSDIAKTDIQLQRLGWTPEQGAAHLQKTYGKRSRRLLTEEELLDFLNYLESLDTPISQDDI